jgi:hypothetical protein
MKRVGSMEAMLGMVGSISGIAVAADGVLTKIPITPGSYCHMKFEAIQDRTLSTDHPALKDSSDGDIIDFYGPCDESPTGADQVHQQELDKFHMAGY